MSKYATDSLLWMRQIIEARGEKSFDDYELDAAYEEIRALLTAAAQPAPELDALEIFRQECGPEDYLPATDTTGEGHCKDCCCAKSWEALGVKEYTGKSIPEHITELKSALLSKPAAGPEWEPIENYDLREREWAVFWCKHEKTIWRPMTGYLRYSGGDKDSPFFVIPCQEECGRRERVTHFQRLSAPPPNDERGG